MENFATMDPLTSEESRRKDKSMIVLRWHPGFMELVNRIQGVLFRVNHFPQSITRLQRTWLGFRPRIEKW